MTATTQLGFQGQAPSVKIGKAPGNPEREKYIKCWQVDDYRRYSPGEQQVELFLDTTRAKRGATVIDWGCGTGRAGHALWKEGLKVTLIDFAPNCLDPAVQADLCDTLTFQEHDLNKRWKQEAEYGICCDVMEHVPENEVNQVLANILATSRHVLFQISTEDDAFGKHEHIDADLHVTVKPYAWWLKKFADLGCVVHRSNEGPHFCVFYVTAHHEFWWNRFVVNTDMATIQENMRANAKFGLKQLTPHEQQDIEIMLLCGGPSLNDYTDEIIEQRKAGMPLVTVNGTYNWTLQHGITPSLQFVIDARAFNKRFVDPIVDGCKYVVASQCSPELVETLPTDRSFLWQVTLEEEYLDTIRELWGKENEGWCPCPGGSTVTLRALCALQMMGFTKVHVYGFDSCVNEQEAHHAYEQEENEGTKLINIRVAAGTPWERTFQCQPWMATQAREFMGLTEVYLKTMQLDIKGDGLIAHLVKTGAAMPADGDS